MAYVINPPALPSLPVAGSEDRFPVRRIFCVGRNYAAHAREMGGDPNREPPFFFMKPGDAVFTGSELPYPPETRELHHEVELVVAIGAGGRNLPAIAALDHVYGYAVGIDLTRRDVQAVLKGQGRSWEMAKAFDRSAPVSAITPARVSGHPQAGVVYLSVNGAIRQSGDLSDMIWPVAEIIAKLSETWALLPGDLIFTGTPEGVGPLQVGDVVKAEVAGIASLDLRIV